MRLPFFSLRNKVAPLILLIYSVVLTRTIGQSCIGDKKNSDHDKWNNAGTL